MTATILICEDEAIVAMDLEMLMEDFGYRVMGPYTSIKTALANLDEQVPQVALLDVRLDDGEVFPVADRLKEMDVPLIFHSGHIRLHDLSESYPDAQCCQKPVSTADLKAALEHALQQGSVEKA